MRKDANQADDISLRIEDQPNRPTDLQTTSTYFSLDNVGLSAANEWEVKELAERARLLATTNIVVTDPTSADIDQALAVFRVLQEGLTNVTRHAQASQVHVTLKRSQESLVLEIWDNGKGINAEAIDNPKTLGLLGMIERMRPFQGSVNLSGTPGRGTTVSVTVSVLEFSQG
ncbi:MAG: ATP-binding protein [Nitrospirae bacterium]|nr:ATP-binding protein [Nitrospirota bacterium]MDE3220938.1 ATP-binding protein [Nitrospirota bacterium]